MSDIRSILRSASRSISRSASRSRLRSTRKRKEIKSVSPTSEPSIKKMKKKTLSNLLEIKKIDILEWVEIPNTRSSQLVFSPDQIEDNNVFIYFFRRFLMQPIIRRHLIHKFRPDIDYTLIKFDYDDTEFDKKTTFIKTRIKEDGDFIIDIAEQLTENGGGHWTSLKRENNQLEYMDSDPLYYGNQLNKLEKILKNIPNPIEIYGDKNKLKNKRKSIQNVHKNDTFCQSWSLFFLTISKTYPNLKDNIKFQENIQISHSDKDAQDKNFPKFIENFLVLLDVWIRLFTPNSDPESKSINNLIINTQWSNWTEENIVKKLNKLKNDIQTNKNEILTDIEKQNELFCLNPNAISEYMQSSRKK